MLPEVQLAVRVRGRHPWFFRKMVRKPARPLPKGGAVRVVDKDGTFVGVGFYNPRSELTLRMLARAEVDDVDAYLAGLLDAAVALRRDVLRLDRVTDAYRVVHSEGDGFPGFVVDRIGDAIVAQMFSLAVRNHIEALGERLRVHFPGARLLLGADREAAAREGFSPPPPVRAQPTEVVEHGARFSVVPGHGHKTGFFADQRDNRQLVRALARGRTVLDLCCHAGGFAVHAALGGARTVVAVDLDEEAVALATENAARNRVRVDVRHDDAFAVLRAARPGAHDLIVLDPPKWIAGKADLDAGLPRYLDLNRAALQKLAPGGLLVTCSCSGALDAAGFEAMLRRAAAEAGRDVRLLDRRGAGPDHPVALECPETGYLKVFVGHVR
ncbi:MAG TPA: class I SAM-dependent rRNA methyltransferase [Planctomycetota bacterium]|nr:class I SAM-dependent rRNA methyltransferase [Planctomycetota bacterium]